MNFNTMLIFFKYDPSIKEKVTKIVAQKTYFSQIFTSLHSCWPQHQMAIIILGRFLVFFFPL